MDPFSHTPPDWVESAIHASQFCCPQCQAACTESISVWINRFSPVYTADNRRKWQEFYQCHCRQAWWAWSSDRPPSPLVKSEQNP
jgi:hypothetical protein